MKPKDIKKISRFENDLKTKQTQMKKEPFFSNYATGVEAA